MLKLFTKDELEELENKLIHDERSVYAVHSWYVEDCPCPIAAISGTPQYEDYVDEYGDTYEDTDCETRKDDIAASLEISVDDLDELVTMYDEMGNQWKVDNGIEGEPYLRLPADVAKGLMITAIELQYNKDN